VIQFPNGCRSVSYENEAEWRDARRLAIGASDTAGIFGMGYVSQSIVTVWSSKTGGPEVEFPPDVKKRVERGKRMEGIISDEVADDLKIPIYDPGDYTIFYHPTFPWLAATLDRIALEDDEAVPVEFKYNDAYLKKAWKGDEPILKYEIQCQHQMAVTGARYCYLAGLVGGNELFVKKIKRDNAFIAAMILKLSEFWGYVNRMEVPPIDGSEATSDWLRVAYPKQERKSIVLPEEAIEWDRRLLEVQEDIKRLKTEEASLKNKLKFAIGDAEEGILPFAVGSYSYLTEERKECVTAAHTRRVLRRSGKKA